MTTLQLYLAAILGMYLVYLGVVIWRRQRTGRRATPSEFWLKDRSVSSLFAILTMFATLFSAGVLVGGAGFYYSHGIGTLWFSIGAYIFMGLLSWSAGMLIWKRSRENPKMLSPIRLALLPYSSSVSRVAVGIIFVFLIPYLSLQVTGLGKLLLSSVNFPEVLTAILLLAVVVLYSEMGGIAEVIKTDVVQATATIGGFVAIGLIIAKRLSFSPAVLKEGLADAGGLGLLALPGPTGFYTIANIVALILVIGAAVITQPQAFKRFMIAKEIGTVRRMAVFVPLMGCLLILLAGLIGFYGFTINPNLPSGDLVIGEVLNSVPPLVAALALFGVVAATMSTSDSLILTFGLLGSEELRDAGGEYFERDEVRLRAGSLLAIAAAAIAGLASLSPPALVANLAVLSASGTMQLLPVLLLGLIGIKIPNVLALLSMLSGVICIIVLQLGFWTSPFGLPAALVGLFFAVAFIAIGVLLRPVHA